MLETVKMFQLNTFRISREIGSGAFARVFKARHPDLGVVALKCLLPSHAGGQESQTFFQEVALLSKSDHINIVKCFGLCQVPKKLAARLSTLKWTGDSDMTWCMVLEYCECGPLSTLLANQMISTSEVYSTEEALDWSLDVSRALLYLQQQTPIIIHRDIKQENVLLTRDPETGRRVAKLADFGLCQAVDRSQCGLLRSSSLSCPNLDMPRLDSGTAMLTAIPEELRQPLAEIARQASQDVDCRPSSPASPHAMLASGGTHLSAAERVLYIMRYSTGGIDRPRQIKTSSQHYFGAVPPIGCERPAEQRSLSSSGAPTRSSQPVLPSHQQDTYTFTRSMDASDQTDARNHRACGSPLTNVAGGRSFRSCSPLKTRTSFVKAREENEVGECDAPRKWESDRQSHTPTDAPNADLMVMSSSPSVGTWASGSDLETQLSLMDGMQYQGGVQEDSTAYRAGQVGGTGAGKAPGDACEVTLGDLLEAAGLRAERDWQHVFSLTGFTGSTLYMAPEVYLKQPYNEKVDIFSLGVVMYELFARTLLVFTQIGTGKVPLARTGEEYAAAVARGYRPPCPAHWPLAMCKLVQECWSPDPCVRPNLCHIMEELNEMRRDVADSYHPTVGCGCRIA